MRKHERSLDLLIHELHQWAIIPTACSMRTALISWQTTGIGSLIAIVQVNVVDPKPLKRLIQDLPDILVGDIDRLGQIRRPSLRR